MTGPASSRSGTGALTSALLHALLVLVLAGGSHAVAAAEDDEARPAGPSFTVPSPGTELWRRVREADAGITRAQGVESGVLINAGGEQWRHLRMGPVTRYSGWAIVVVVVGLFLFHLVKGSTRLKDGRSGETVERWARFQRLLHWYTAALFIVLALTGLTLLFGRHVIAPVIGLQAFGTMALVAKNLHNYLGPLFCIGVVLMVLILLRANLPTWNDVVWLVRLGGAIGKKHIPVGRFNAGEKLVTYGSMATLGIVVCATGLFLDFPNIEFPYFTHTRENMQIAHLVHTIAAGLWILSTLGHIYLGTAGVEGTFESMWTGRVDANWAKQHHDAWYEDVVRSKQDGQGDGRAPAGAD